MTPKHQNPLDYLFALRYGGKPIHTESDRSALVGWTPQNGELFRNADLRTGLALRMAFDIPSDKLLIGTGFNSATGEKGGNVVAFDPDHESSELTSAVHDAGQKVVYRLKQVTEVSEVLDALSVSAAASFGFGIFSGVVVTT